MPTLVGEAAERETAAQMSRNPSSFMRHPLPSISIGGNLVPPSPDFVTNFDKWRTIRESYEGELTIKRAGERYLRRPANVKANDYDTYKNRGYFYNATRRTHTGLLGSMIRKHPEVKLPAGSRLNLASLTIRGQSFRELTREILSELILLSRYGLLVDIPKKTPTGTPPRPYFSGYKAESIYATRKTLHKGLEITDRVILLEEERVDTEYGYTTTPIIRVLRLDPDPDFPTELCYSQQIIRPTAQTSAGQPASTSDTIEDIPILIQGRKLRYIPFVFINPINLQPESIDPVLLDLVMINLAHYEATALLQHGRFYAGMPTYYIAGEGASKSEIADGLGSSEPMSVGPSNVWMLEQGDKAGLLEFNGHGLTFLENAVDSMQLQMQSLGGKMIPTQRKAAALSSEAYGLMEAGDEVTLMDIALQTEQALSNAILFAMDMQNNPIESTTAQPINPNNPAAPTLYVELNKEFIRSELTAREVRAIQTLYERRLIPLDVLYYTLRQIGIVPMEYTLEDFKALLGQPNQLYNEPPPQDLPTPPRDPNIRDPDLPPVVASTPTPARTPAPTPT